MVCQKDNILVFPTGIINTAIYVYLLWKWTLLGDMMINFYYVVMSVYGWYHWTRKKENVVEYPISRMTFSEKKWSFIIFVLTILFVVSVYTFLINLPIGHHTLILWSQEFFRWNVANGTTKNRELDFMDYWWYHFHTNVFCQRIFIHEYPIFNFYNYCHLWLFRMEENSKRKRQSSKNMVLTLPILNKSKFMVFHYIKLKANYCYFNLNS